MKARISGITDIEIIVNEEDILKLSRKRKVKGQGINCDGENKAYALFCHFL